MRDHLKRTGVPMTEEEVLHILPQILDALDAAHNYSDGDKQGILHLDLKPANIMIDRQGNVKLIDFGASKQQSVGGGATTSTAVSYTQGYAPREQMEQNLEKFGPWTDFYALGATLYTLLTNKKPPLPSDIDDDETPDKHLSLLMPQSVNENTKRLILWLMQTNRKKRPQNVEAIKRFLDGDEDVTIASDEQLVDDDGVGEAEPSTTSDDSGETLIAGQNDAEVSNGENDNPQPQPQPEILPLDNPNKGCSEKKVVVGIIAVFAIIIIFFFAAKGCGGNKNQTAVPLASSDTVAVADSMDVDTTAAEAYVTKQQCHVMQGDCTYTGTVNEDGVPNGDGEAWFKDGRYYKGYFANGMMVDDDAFFRFPNGDTYKGSFVNDHFSNGRYMMSQDKSYFIGTYDCNGQPKRGAWYDKNGNKIQNV